MNRRDFLERTAAVLGGAAITQKLPETEAEFPPTTIHNQRIDGQFVTNRRLVSSNTTQVAVWEGPTSRTGWDASGNLVRRGR